MAERIYYVISEDNCRFPSLTREQIYEAITEATGNVPQNVDDAFITRLKEQNSQKPLKIWVGTQAEFNALEEKDLDTLYYYDDNDYEELLAKITNILNGTTPVETAENSVNVTTSINGQALTDIFESNGKKVKNATASDSATNVSTNINDIPLNQIFESDGKKVKNATASDSAAALDSKTIGIYSTGARSVELTETGFYHCYFSVDTGSDTYYATASMWIPQLASHDITPNQYGNLIKYDGTLKAIVGANSSYTYNFIAIIKTGFKAV